jgi:hypothetical protein
MSLLTRLGYRGRHAEAAADVSPAGTTAGGSQLLPPYPFTINRDCECGNPGDVVVDGQTRCTSCFLTDITPWKRHRR